MRSALPVLPAAPAAALPDVADDHTRRAFLADAGRVLAGAGLARYVPWAAALAACARDDARRGAPFRTFTAAEGRTFRAVAAQILPSGDGLPGAEEAGAAHFADRALASFFATRLPGTRAGLAALDARARAVVPNVVSFADLDADRQTAVLREIERDPFFAGVRRLVVIGTFADPSYGGNQGGAGWRLLDVDHRPMYEAPYGWYDAEAARDTTRAPDHAAGAPRPVA
ncbi:MAG TPA: gluconate 2-dehydrogenase subunit 3 family protein [Gemmatirosa sp.]